jgi:hypothetical protein
MRVLFKNGTEIEGGAEGTHTRQDRGTVGCGDGSRHELLGAIGGVDIDAGLCIN